MALNAVEILHFKDRTKLEREDKYYDGESWSSYVYRLLLTDPCSPKAETESLANLPFGALTLIVHWDCKTSSLTTHSRLGGMLLTVSVTTIVSCPLGTEVN